MDANTLLVADYLDAVRLRGRSPRTVDVYRYSLGRLLRSLGDTDVRNATPRDVRRFLSRETEAGTAPSSVLRFFRDSRVFFAWLVTEGEAATNPCDRVDAPSAPVTPVRTIPPETLRKLLAVRGRGRFADHRNRLALLLLMDTGIRAGELLSVEVSDVNVTNNTVTVTGKTGPRTVGFGSRTGIELRRYLRVRMSHNRSGMPELLLTRNGPWSYNSLYRFLRRYCERAGVEPVHPHRFRHTWASRQLESDAGELTVMHAGGWASVTHMRRYTREATQRRAAELNQRQSLADRL